jgi:hypothetical protein
MTPLPNLQELEKVVELNALEYAKSNGVPIEYCLANRTVEMWCQVWSDSSAGTAHEEADLGFPGLTEGYVTIFTYKFLDTRDQKAYELYSVTYGTNATDGFLAMKEEMDEHFYEDWKAHNVIALWEVIAKYQ